MPYALEILRLEICFAILIPWPEKEQNPCSQCRESKIQRAPKSLVWRKVVYQVSWWFLYFRLSRPDGVSITLLTSRVVFLAAPKKGWACVPRRGHP